MSFLLLIFCVILIILFTAKWKVHPFMVLLLVAIFYGLISGMPFDQIVTSVNKGFGNTLGGIGMIIILGVIIGAFLEKSGGAYRLAEKVLQFTGKKRIPTSMSLIGWIVSIPVFCDSGFMLLAPLAKSITKKAGITFSTTAVMLGLGLLASHVMVPPTPGPIAAAHYLDVDIGMVMMFGIPISLTALLVTQIILNSYISKKYINPSPEISEEKVNALITKAPTAFRSSLPIIIPIILIIVSSLLKTSNAFPEETIPTWASTLLFLGEPFIALLIGCFFAFALPKKKEWAIFSTSGWIGQALISAASILLITGAGGIFGQVLRDSGIAKTIGETLSQWNLGLFLPFLLAAAIKTAQGSSTVAIITASTMIAPMLSDIGLVENIDKTLAVLAIGAGSAVVIHANDSFFWVISRTSHMDVKDGYRYLSLGSFVFGVVGFLVIMGVSVVA